MDIYFSQHYDPKLLMWVHVVFKRPCGAFLANTKKLIKYSN